MKAKLIIIISLMAMIVTGCSSTRVENFLNTNISSAVRDRVDANKAIVNKLYVSGLISEKERESIVSNIDSSLEKLSRNDKETQRKLMASMVDWVAPEWDGEEYGPTKVIRYLDKSGEMQSKTVNRLKYTKVEWEQDIITTYIYKEGLMKYVEARILDGEGATIVPIELIDGQTGEMINERFAYSVYTLKPFGDKSNSIGGVEERGQTLDELVGIIGKASGVGSDQVDNSVLDKYFQKAVDSNGKAVTLLDITKEKNQVVRDSSGSDLVSDSTYSYGENGMIEEDAGGNKVIESIMDNNQKFSTRGSNKPGSDMIIREGKVEMMALRFHEFNSKAVNKVIKTMGMSKDKYVFTTYGGENRVYIMEYPIYYIKSLVDEGKRYSTEIEESLMGINIKTGDIVKKHGAWVEGEDEEKDTDVNVDMENAYLKVGGAKNEDGESESSFIVKGICQIKVGERGVLADTGRVVLRDYLEAVEMDTDNNEKLAVLGRKVRFLEVGGGNKNSIVAEYINSKGEIGEGVPLYIDDFSDSVSTERYLGRYSEKVEVLRDNEEAEEENKEEAEEENKEEAEEENNEETEEENNESRLEGSTEFYEGEGDRINISEMFPGKDLGKIDYGKRDSKPLFYCVSIRKNIFDSALYSGWIENKSEDHSLAWWNRWLSERGFMYKININPLKMDLGSSYKFEVDREGGVVVFDLKTAANVSKIMEEESVYGMKTKVRTIFHIIGYGLISYSIILLGAWAVDVSVDFNLKILGTLTLGNWVAVRDKGMEGIGGIEFREMVIRSLVIMILGIVLMGVNIVSIVEKVYEAVGGLSELFNINI